MLEKIKLTKSTRVTKNSSSDYVLQAVPENMELLMDKINELIEEVNDLRKEVERLNKVKAGKPVIMGGGSWK
jgi:hypothetical protein